MELSENEKKIKEIGERLGWGHLDIFTQKGKTVLVKQIEKTIKVEDWNELFEYLRRSNSSHFTVSFQKRKPTFVRQITEIIRLIDTGEEGE